MNILDYLLPRSAFQLRGTTEKMDDRCIWCGNLELGVPKRTKGVHKTYAVPGGFIFAKGRTAYERYALTAGGVFLVTERGVSGGLPEWRRMTTQLWAHNGGGEWNDDFVIDEYPEATRDNPNRIRAVLTTQQTGPLTLSNRDHLATLSRLMGRDAESGILLLRSLPGQVGHPTRPLKVLALSQRWGGSNTLPKTDDNSDHMELYLYARIKAGGAQITFGSVGWLKFTRIDGEWVLMRRTIWHELVREEPGQEFVTPDHVGLMA